MSKILRGIVVSDKMTGTVIVEVGRFVKHLKYGKYIKIHKKFKAHDPENKHRMGDEVRIREIAPISKDKHFIVI